jgi:two-component system, NtrC family, sensor histidine kinase PilS
MDRKKWLLRLSSFRAIIFTVFVAVELGLAQPGTQHRGRDMALLLFTVYALSACWYALVRVNHNYVAQAYAQIAIDLLLITWTVNRTGGIDSSFSSLYFLEIVMSSILLERRGAFMAATASSVIHLAHMDLAYFGTIPTTTVGMPELSTLQYLISKSIFGFCAVGYLSNYLAETLRSTGAQLERSTGQVAFLRAFSDRIVDCMGNGLVTTDLDGRVYLVNRAAEDITGLNHDDALDMTIWQVFPGLSSTVESARFELPTTRHDGKDIYLRFTVTPVMIDDKNTAGFVWTFEDLTELRSLERQMRQKEQMAAIGVMSAGIAHEIRNPLASISGSFKLLRSDLQLNEDQSHLMTIISRETERLNRIITDFLSYARPITPKPESVELSALIAETCSLMRNSSELKPSHVIDTLLQPVNVMVDESMLRQVFYNLASNAFKAMPDGGKLTVRLEARNGGARIRFEDTGVGLTEDELKRLFVPFNSNFRNGTGLGLPIVYQIINAHNGTISARSRKGAGTTFVIDI